MANPDPKILLRRGTDTERTDGTLGTPQQGEPCYTTDTKALFVGDGSTSGGIPVTRPASVISLISTVSQNINAAATNNHLEWNAAAPKWGVDFTHSTTTNKDEITINTTGYYEFSATVALDATASTPTRYNGIMRMQTTAGAGFGPQGKGGYIREASGQDETSLHIPTFIYQVSAGTVVRLTIDREATTTDAVDTTPRCSNLYIKRIG